MSCVVSLALKAVSIPKRDLEEFRPQPPGTPTIFSFQGSVARMSHQYSILGNGLSIDRFHFYLQTQ